MLKNYITVAFRAFTRNITFSIIHILGLSIGISAALVIYLLVHYENSFDTFEADRERIYRVVLDLQFGAFDGHSPAVPAPAANAIQNEVSGVTATIPVMQFQGDGTAKVKVMQGSALTLRTEAVTFKKQPEIIFTNNAYFDLIPFQWLAGSKTMALTEPFSVVLTETRARQYFPHAEPRDVVGKEILYNDDFTAIVTGVVEDFEAPTDFTSVEFISYATIAKTHLQDQFMMNVWNDWMAYSKLYIKLDPGSRADEVTSRMNVMLSKYNPPVPNEQNKIRFVLQPLSDIHFNLQYAGFGQRTANRNVLMGLLAIAAFLLLLACINFTNLATAQASQRAREIGIRKTSGSSRKQLVIQFLSETFLITLLAVLVSVSLTPLLLQSFAEFLPAGLRFDLFSDLSVWGFLVVFTIVVTFVAGLYPAIVLSGYKPSAVLKNYAFAGAPTRSAGIRKVLTVSQFVIAQFFVIAAFMVGKQIHFALNQDLGYRKEAILNFNLPRDTVHHERLLNEIASLPEVENVSAGFLPPAMEGGAFANITYDDGTQSKMPPNDRLRSVQLRFGDANYLDIYHIKLVAGRNVRTGANINETLINEHYAKLLGFRTPADAVGKELTFGDDKKVPIVGVMQDFHEGSLHNPIGSVVYQSRPWGSTFHVALKPQPAGSDAWQHAIAKITKAVNAAYPDHDFEYSFFDDMLARLYMRERNASVLLNWATGLSVLISCLGLLGLVIYTSAARTKEIGVRKILGASITHIVTLLSTEFMKLVVIAFVIAAPLAAWAADKWLQSFAYRTSISWWVFAVCGAMLVAVAMITLSVQTIKTARANPVNSLRNE